MNITSMLLCALVLFALSACGGGGGGEPTSTSSTVNTEASNTTTGANTQNSTDTNSNSDTSDNNNTDANESDQVAETVTYQLTFTRSWEVSNFPTNFPENSHFSPLVGLTHNQDGFIFKPDTTASAGIVSMAETGSKSSLKNEISTIQNAGNSNYLIDESGVSGSAKSVTFTFEASQQYPLLSVVSMVAPSPDWFIGLESFPLFTDNQWIDSQIIQLKVYDAGSDSGTRFSSVNQATSPAESIMLLTSDPSDSDFSQGVHAQSGDYIGMIELKRL